jgi:hypothetical protein
MPRCRLLSCSSFVFASIICLSAHAQPLKILTNHIGYDSSGPKHAVVLGRAGDRVASFKVKEYETEKEIFAGSSQDVGQVKKWKYWHFWTIDFDDVADEGTYYVECATDKGVARSFPFEIRRNLLERNALSNVVFYVKGQRCSGLLDKADRQMKFENSDKAPIDVQGGWFDATGDYGKHLSHLSFSTYLNPQQTPMMVLCLFKTYDALSARNDPNFAQIKRRLLDEALYGADYLVRVKNPDGSFYRTVAGRGPGKKPEDRLITRDDKSFSIKTTETKDKLDQKKQTDLIDQLSYEVGYRSGGGVAIAALAMAGACKVSGDFTSEDYLKAAEDAFAYLEKNNINHTNDGKENIVDDYCALLAATELYKATHGARYKTAADKRAQNLMSRIVSGGGQTDYWRADDRERPFFHAVDAGLPVVSLLYYLETADAEMQKKVLDTVKKSMIHELAVTEEVSNPFGYSRQFVENKAGERRTSFFFPHDTETAPWWQGENARLASMAAAARLAAGHYKQDKVFHDKLQKFACNQLNWILGLNPFDTCMLHGSGRNSADYLFFDSYEYKIAPGGISNGITSGYRDEEDIDFDLHVAQTGKDDDWRWTEQWLPHAAWFLLAVAAGN